MTSPTATIAASRGGAVTDKGDAVRLAILAELLRRERAHEPPPTYGELGELLDKDPAGVYRHLRVMRRRKLVHWQSGRARTLVLTDLGRLTAEALPDTAR